MSCKIFSLCFLVLATAIPFEGTPCTLAGELDTGPGISSIAAARDSSQQAGKVDQTSASGSAKGTLETSQPTYQMSPASQLLSQPADLIGTEADPNSLIRLIQDEAVGPLPAATTPLQMQLRATSAATQFTANVFGRGEATRSLLTQSRRRRARGLTRNIVFGSGSKFRAATDAGSLLV